MFVKNIVAFLLVLTVSTGTLFAFQVERIDEIDIEEIESPSEPGEAEPKAQRAFMKDGKLFVVGADGEKQEIDTAGARSVSIQQSSKTVERDGETQLVAGGQAVIIGQDGEKTVIEFEGDVDLGGIGGAGGIRMPIPDFPRLRMPPIPEMGGLPGFPGAPRAMRLEREAVGKFMVGAHCQSVDEALRGHLQLDEGIGLIVKSVTPDSPAAKANLQVHDILLFADDQQLGSLTDLTQAVDRAGDEERSLALTFIRKGTEESGEITPVKRPQDQLGVRPWPRAEWREAEPGIIIEGGFGEFDMKEHREMMDDALNDMREQMKAMRLEMRERMDRQRDRR